MTKEHLGLALALNVPVFVVVTKIDMCPANILQGQSMQSYCSTDHKCRKSCKQGHTNKCCLFRNLEASPKDIEVSRLQKDPCASSEQR